MQPLVDADILLYECGWVAEYGMEDIPPFSVAEDFLLNRIEGIKNAVGATAPPIFYLTGKGNFRIDIAQRKAYKGNRKDLPKPYHYDNLKVYLRDVLGAIIVDGIEADDAMCIEQTKRLAMKDTVICTRDKDLRQCPGWHYGWESGKQGEFYLQEVDELGWLKRNDKKVSGVGSKFFYYQLLVGDTTDNIPGCPKIGPVKAFDIISELDNDIDMYNAVFASYVKVFGDDAEQELTEQAYLLWMVRELDEDGNPVMWRKPEWKRT